MRRPRIQGLPSHCRGSTVIRSKAMVAIHDESYHVPANLTRNHTPGRTSRCGGSFLAALPALTKLQDARGDMFGAQPELLNQFPGFAGESEPVIDPDHIEQQRVLVILAISQDGTRHDVSESPHLVLFSG